MTRRVSTLIRRARRLEDDLSALWGDLPEDEVILRSLVRQALSQLVWARCCLEDVKNELNPRKD